MIALLVSIFEWLYARCRVQARLGDLVHQNMSTAAAPDREHVAEERMQEREMARTGAIAPVRAPSSISASKLTMSQLEALLNTLECIVAPVFGDPTILDDLQELGQEAKWEPSAEASLSESLIAQMEQHLKLPPGVDIVSAKRALAAKETDALVQGMYGLDLKVKGRNEVLFVPSLVVAMALRYAFIGVKFKKTLTYENLEEAQAEFIAWGLHSYSAFIQVFTNLRSGGVAYWSDPERCVPDKQLIRQRYFVGMPALYTFINSTLAALPESMLGYHCDGSRYEGNLTVCSQELQEPRRCKLIDVALEQPEAKLDVLKTFFGMLDDDDAAKPDVSLAAWFPEGGDEPVRFPDHPS
ncbi:hypothetical protein COCOBI_01-8680 [Coccomyxa sp. Obi]|nr:hypothetical protein COCOBI_01-8680 [Coccomyxa sp. Obi]